MRAVFVVVRTDGESVGALALGASVGGAVEKIALVASTVRRRAKRDLELGFYRLIVGEEGDDLEAAPVLAYRYLSSYEAVVVLDPATLVLDSVAPLFGCPSVCAVYDGASNEARDVPVVLRPKRLEERDIRRTLDTLATCDFWDPDDVDDLRREEEEPQGLLRREEALALHQSSSSSSSSGVRSCRRLPERYGASALFLLLNGGDDDPRRLVRAANTEAAWLAKRRASIARLALGPARPWEWWAVPIAPLASDWRRSRDSALENLRRHPGYDTSEHLRDRASENFALARAIVLPWLVVAFALVVRSRSAAAVASRRPQSKAPRKVKAKILGGRVVRDLLLRHMGLVVAAGLGFLAARGAPAYHTFFRPSRQLLYARSPGAGASVFYSTFAAGFAFVLLLGRRPPRPRRRRRRPGPGEKKKIISSTKTKGGASPSLGKGPQPSPWDLASVLALTGSASFPLCLASLRPDAAPTLLSVVPFALAFLAVPIVATLAFLAEEDFEEEEEDQQDATSADDPSTRPPLASSPRLSSSSSSEGGKPLDAYAGSIIRRPSLTPRNVATVPTTT